MNNSFELVRVLINVVDCLRGIKKAIDCGFVDFNKFDIEEFEHFEKVENGDLTWLGHNVCAFAGPHNTHSSSVEGYYTLTPEDYIPHFKKRGVGMVIRLNKKYYDEGRFTREGIQHRDLYYLDGSTPTDEVLQTFLTIMEGVDPAINIAVHCKAGLGRTGSCIGAYWVTCLLLFFLFFLFSFFLFFLYQVPGLSAQQRPTSLTSFLFLFLSRLIFQMKHYGWTGAEVIGWMRVCRPGMVIGPQQHWMERMQEPMWRQGDAYRAKNSGDKKSSGGGSMMSPSRSSGKASVNSPHTKTNAKGESQGDFLRSRRSPKAEARR